MGARGKHQHRARTQSERASYTKRTTMIGTGWLLRAAVAMTAMVGSFAQADEVADFYKGKQINVVVGSGAGGGYDVYTRLLARHMPRYVRGHPTMVVQNMPGAGSLRAAN